MNLENRKFLILIISRLGLFGLFHAASIFLHFGQGSSSQFIAFFIYALSVIYFLLWKYVPRGALLYNLQFYLDLASVSVLLHLSGGIDSLFTPAFVLIIVYASLMRGREGGILALTLSVISYTAVVNVGYLVLIPADQAAYRDVFLRIALTVLGLVIVAGLGVYLSERLQRARWQLGTVRGSLQAFKFLHQNIVNSVRSGLITLDLEGHITFLNRAAQEICGDTASELLSQPLSAVFPRHVLERILDSDFQNHSRALRIECPVKNRKGKTVFLGMSCSPLISEKNEKTGFVVSLQDLTEIRALEEKAQFKEKMAAIGELAAGLAHEIRNPLGSMSGSIQILRSELQLSDERGRLVEIVLRESERLNKIVEDFLAYAGPPPSTPKQLVNLSSLVRDTAALCRNNPEFKESHDIAISPTPGPIQCLGNPDQLQQVVWNILRNGLRAMPDGGKLSIELRDENSRTRMSFRDEGIGMTPQEIRKLFQPFHSGFKTGVDLGMAIVYQIIDQHQGHIDIESRQGEGTVVKISLPVSEEG